ncbi:hypothetical protein ACLOJK_005299 [Asimina triloba]
MNDQNLKMKDGIKIIVKGISGVDVAALSQDVGSESSVATDERIFCFSGYCDAKQASAGCRRCLFVSKSAGGGLDSCGFDDDSEPLDVFRGRGFFIHAVELIIR